MVGGEESPDRQDRRVPSKAGGSQPETSREQKRGKKGWLVNWWLVGLNRYCNVQWTPDVPLCRVRPRVRCNNLASFQGWIYFVQLTHLLIPLLQPSLGPVKVSVILIQQDLPDLAVKN